MNLARGAVVCFVLLWTVAPAWADRTQEDQRDKRYVQCLAQNNVDPSDIPPEISASCKREAGIPDPGEAARTASSEAWRNCLLDKSVDFDDRTSPVREVAEAIVQLCAKEWNAYVAALWMPYTPKREMARGLRTYGVDEGVRAVLLHRRVRRERDNPKR